MIITVKVNTKAKKTELIPLSENEFKAKLTAAPIDGAANKQLIELVSEHFNIPKSKISIKVGKSSPLKLIEIK